jgi:murein L,D-transpeptidase YcbB/YkuD
LDPQPDTTLLKEAILQYQRLHGLEPDGKVGKQFIQSINLTDRVKLKRLLITLDRYKLLPDSTPPQYVWVNIPAFQLEAWMGDSLAVASKIVFGKPITPTPIITSEIYDMVTYPTWTVPASIIKKEMLPGLKKSSGYLSKKGLELYNHKGEKIDPSTVNWSKYKKGIPYQIKQGSGDNNALGVIKFNFKNPHDVYLHDTNQRHFFKNSMRALSHGCVRVQNWLSLAEYLVRNDSISMALKGDSLTYAPDSVSSWIAAKKKQRIPLKSRVPIFINYFSCAVVDDQLVFYNDVYDEDGKLIEKYFNN